MENSSITITIDRSLCIGAAACISAAPELFQLDEDNIAETKTPNPIFADTLASQRIRDAVDSCPTGAIQVSITKLG